MEYVGGIRIYIASAITDVYDTEKKREGTDVGDIIAL